MKNKALQLYLLLRDYILIYLPVHRKMSEKTIQTYKQALNQYRIYLSDEKKIPFSQIDFGSFSRNLIYGFLMWMRDVNGNSIQTLNLRLAAIKSFLRYCSEENIELTAVYLTAASIHSFKGAEKLRVEHLTESQLKLLFSTPPTDTKVGRRDRFFIILAYEIGGRMQELLSLKLSDIMRTEKFIQIRIFGKGEKTRYVPLLSDTKDHLEAYLEEFHSDREADDYLFYTIHNGQHTQMKPGAVDYFLKKYAKIAVKSDKDFPLNLHCHMLRHSIAMAMYKQEIPISYIKDFLGHSSLDSTAIYAYADSDTIAHALEKVTHAPSPKKKNTIEKKWKGKEEELLKFCGLE